MNMQVHKYANIQVRKHVNWKVYKYASMQVCIQGNKYEIYEFTSK